MQTSARYLEQRIAVPPDSAVVTLATFQTPPLDGGALLVNGVQIVLEPIGRAVVAARGAAAAGKICASLTEFPADALRRAVRDLARHDVVSIES